MKKTTLTIGFALLTGMSHLPYSIAENPSFSAKSTDKTERHFSAGERPASTAGACGSHSSISAALDQCGKKGIISALCKKKNGKWSCLPSEDKTNPNIRFTGAARQ